MELPWLQAVPKSEMDVMNAAVGMSVCSWLKLQQGFVASSLHACKLLSL